MDKQSSIICPLKITRNTMLLRVLIEMKKKKVFRCLR